MCDKSKLFGNPKTAEDRTLRRFVFDLDIWEKRPTNRIFFLFYMNQRRATQWTQWRTRWRMLRMTKHSCQELVETVSRRVCNHHVGCKLLAVENPHSVRHSPAMKTHRWNPMSKARATAPCIRLLHLVGPQLVRTVNKWFARTQNSSSR